MLECCIIKHIYLLRIRLVSTHAAHTNIQILHNRIVVNNEGSFSCKHVSDFIKLAFMSIIQSNQLIYSIYHTRDANRIYKLG